MSQPGRFDPRYSSDASDYVAKRYRLTEAPPAPAGRAAEAVSLKIQTALLQVKQSYEKRHPDAFPKGDARQVVAFLLRLCMSHPDDYGEISPFETWDNIRRVSWGRQARRISGDPRDPIAGYEPVVAAMRAARTVLLQEIDFEMLPTEAVLRDAEKVASEPPSEVEIKTAGGILLPPPGGTVPAKRKT